MTISLQKGGNVSLSKQVPGLNRVRFGLGWDLRKTDGADFDLDASAFLLNADGQVLSNQHFIYYNNPIDPSGAVAHQGDNRTGEGEGDDEVIDIDLGKHREAHVVLALAEGADFLVGAWILVGELIAREAQDGETL